MMLMLSHLQSQLVMVVLRLLAVVPRLLAVLRLLPRGGLGGRPKLLLLRPRPNLLLLTPISCSPKQDVCRPGVKACVLVTPDTPFVTQLQGFFGDHPPTFLLHWHQSFQ